MADTVYSLWRESLQATLATVYPTYQVVPGDPGDVIPPEDFGVVYVWIEKTELDTNNKQIETVTAGVKVFPLPTPSVDPTTPVDPTTVESLAYQLQVGLSPGQISGDPWYFEIINVEMNYSPEYILAEIAGIRWDPFALGN